MPDVSQIRKSKGRKFHSETFESPLKHHLASFVRNYHCRGKRNEQPFVSRQQPKWNQRINIMCTQQDYWLNAGNDVVPLIELHCPVKPLNSPMIPINRRMKILKYCLFRHESNLQRKSNPTAITRAQECNHIRSRFSPKNDNPVGGQREPKRWWDFEINGPESA